jgi:hypothetical protein
MSTETSKASLTATKNARMHDADYVDTVGSVQCYA